MTISGRSGQDELRIEPLDAALAAYRLNPEDVLNTLNVVRREGVRMQVGFTLADGRELPLTVRRPELSEFQVLRSIEALSYRDGGRRLAARRGDDGNSDAGRADDRAPQRPARAVHRATASPPMRPRPAPTACGSTKPIEEIVRSAYRPPGYTIEACRLRGEHRLVPSCS